MGGTGTWMRKSTYRGRRGEGCLLPKERRNTQTDEWRSDNEGEHVVSGETEPDSGSREEPFIALPLHPPLAHIRRPGEIPLCLPGLSGKGAEGTGRGQLISLFLSFLIVGLFHPVEFTCTESFISLYRNEKAWLELCCAGL